MKSFRKVYRKVSRKVSSEDARTQTGRMKIKSEEDGNSLGLNGRSTTARGHKDSHLIDQLTRTVAIKQSQSLSKLFPSFSNFSALQATLDSSFDCSFDSSNFSCKEPLLKRFGKHSWANTRQLELPSLKRKKSHPRTPTIELHR